MAYWFPLQRNKDNSVEKREIFPTNGIGRIGHPNTKKEKKKESQLKPHTLHEKLIQNGF